MFYVTIIILLNIYKLLEIKIAKKGLFKLKVSYYFIKIVLLSSLLK